MPENKNALFYLYLFVISALAISAGVVISFNNEAKDQTIFVEEFNYEITIPKSWKVTNYHGGAGKLGLGERSKNVSLRLNSSIWERQIIKIQIYAMFEEQPTLVKAAEWGNQMLIDNMPTDEREWYISIATESIIGRNDYPVLLQTFSGQGQGTQYYLTSDSTMYVIVVYFDAESSQDSKRLDSILESFTILP